MRILLATSNTHKLNEARVILQPKGIDVFGLDEIDGTFDEPVEDADTFEGNARLKATGYAEATGMRCMADDSGLVVDALQGLPGVHSARFSGTGTTREECDEANNKLLLSKLRDVPKEKRTARFVCAICVADPDGTVVGEATGTFEGEITREPKGTNGFGYDPLLFIPELNMTSAELSAEEKNERSHRGEAMRTIISCFEL